MILETKTSKWKNTFPGNSAFIPKLNSHGIPCFEAMAPSPIAALIPLMTCPGLAPGWRWKDRRVQMVKKNSFAIYKPWSKWCHIDCRVSIESLHRIFSIAKYVAMRLHDVTLFCWLATTHTSLQLSFQGNQEKHNSHRVPIRISHENRVLKSIEPM